jgi:hypothetical protein
MRLLTLGKINCATSEVSFCAEMRGLLFGKVRLDKANLFGREHALYLNAKPSDLLKV